MLLIAAVNLFLGIGEVQEAEGPGGLSAKHTRIAAIAVIVVAFVTAVAFWRRHIEASNVKLPPMKTGGGEMESQLPAAL